MSPAKLPDGTPRHEVPVPARRLSADKPVYAPPIRPANPHATGVESARS